MFFRALPEQERMEIVTIRHGVMISRNGIALERRRCNLGHSMNNGIIGSQRGAFRNDMAALLRLFSLARFRRATPFLRDGRRDSHLHCT